VEVAIITESPTVLRDGVATVANGSISLRITPDAGTQISEVRDHEFNDHLGQPAVIHRIVLKPTISSSRVTLGCTIRLQ